MKGDRVGFVLRAWEGVKNFEQCASQFRIKRLQHIWKFCVWRRKAHSARSDRILKFKRADQISALFISVSPWNRNHEFCPPSY